MLLTCVLYCLKVGMAHQAVLQPLNQWVMGCFVSCILIEGILEFSVIDHFYSIFSFRLEVYSNEGTHFVVAFSWSPSSLHHAEIIINARQTTTVTVSTSWTTDVFTVYGNWSYHHDIHYNMRTTTWIEDKGSCTPETQHDLI